MSNYNEKFTLNTLNDASNILNTKENLFRIKEEAWNLISPRNEIIPKKDSENFDFLELKQKILDFNSK